jgi:YbgC/YbaW family acyl-CoA thioester hydrolase
VSVPAVFEVEARSYELDPYGHLNNAVYVNWLEQGRLVFLRARGETYTTVPERFGVHIVVVHQDISYRAQVRLGDRLAVSTRIARLGGSSFTFEQSIAFLDGRSAADGRVTMACVGPGGRSTPIPDGLRSLLAS